MFKHNPLKRTALSLVAAIALMSFAACSNDSGEPLFGANGQPNSSSPTLPPMSSMTMDLSFFGIDGTSIAQAQAMNEEMMLAGAGDRTNWIAAVIRVLYVQLTLFDVLEEPVGAFAAAIHSVPQAQADGSYLWTFIFVEEGNEYSIFLHGKEEGDHVAWRLEVSTNIPGFMLDHFVWFDGESKLDESGGFWQFYKPLLTGGEALASMSAATDGAPVVRMDWKNYNDVEAQLTILVNEVGGEDEGDMLAFHATPSVGTIDYHDADVAEDNNITWYADGSGSLTVADYNNGAQSCWDTNQKDTVCP